MVILILLALFLAFILTRGLLFAPPKTQTEPPPPRNSIKSGP